MFSAIVYSGPEKIKQNMNALNVPSDIPIPIKLVCQLPTLGFIFLMLAALTTDNKKTYWKYNIGTYINESDIN